MFKTGQAAPNKIVTLFDGSQQYLSDFWRTQKLVLVFLRHLG